MPVLTDAEKQNYDSVVQQAVRKGASTTDIENKRLIHVAEPTGASDGATKGYVDSKLAADDAHIADINGTCFATIANAPAQYLYVGEITDFFSQRDNLFVFNVYGRCDYDTVETQQAHYDLIVRMSGTYTDRLFIDYHKIKEVTDGDKKAYSRARAYFKNVNGGTVRLFLSILGPFQYGTVGIRYESLSGKGIFTPSMTFLADYTTLIPAGFSPQSGASSGWLDAR